MSLRPTIFAADLGKFRSFIGSMRHPAPLMEAVERFFSEHGPAATSAEIAQEIIQLRAGSWAGKPETERQVYIIGALAQASGLHRDEAIIHWGDWKIGAYENYFGLVKPALPSVSAGCCNFLLSGRALFGTAIDTEWSYYSYLRADELRQFAGDLSDAHARLPQLDLPTCIHGFPAKFREWLRQIEQRRADLWLFAE